MLGDYSLAMLTLQTDPTPSFRGVIIGPTNDPWASMPHFPRSSSSITWSDWSGQHYFLFLQEISKNLKPSEKQIFPKS